MQDGTNANKFAEDYKLTRSSVNNKNIMKVKLAKGGGWVAILKK